jgi:hypothetical protein
MGGKRRARRDKMNAEGKGERVKMEQQRLHLRSCASTYAWARGSAVLRLGPPTGCRCRSIRMTRLRGEPAESEVRAGDHQAPSA